MSEKTPPTDPLHRRLWQMGFDEPQRKIIIDVSGKMNADPVDIGIFCMTGRAAQDIANLQIAIAPSPWYVEAWSWIRYVWQWITSWRFELCRRWIE